MKLDRAVNLAILLVCGLLSAQLVRNLSRPVPTVGPGRAGAQNQGPREGDKISDTKDLKLSSVDRTLVLVTASSCRFCTDSMAFYRRLTDVARQRRIAVLGATGEDPRINETYLSLNQVKLDRVISASDNKIQVVGTPTLLLLDSRGTVLKVWRGRLSADAEQTVLTALSSL
jgi:hypothetical protein